MSSEYWARQSNEDLEEAIGHGLDNPEPCWCGTPEEGSCPACGVAMNGMDALKELMRRIEASGGLR